MQQDYPEEKMQVVTFMLTSFSQNRSSSKLVNLFWRLLATWQWATRGCLHLLWQPKVSSSQHHLFWGDPGQRCCNIFFLQQRLEHQTVPWHCPRRPMVGGVVQDSLLLRPAWSLPSEPTTSTNPQQRWQHLSSALDTSVKIHPGPIFTNQLFITAFILLFEFWFCKLAFRIIFWKRKWLT